MNRKFYDECPILHQYPKYPIDIIPIQVANDQLKTVKEAIKFPISLRGHRPLGIQLICYNSDLLLLYLWIEMYARYWKKE